jgi:hypothetical protein
MTSTTARPAELTGRIVRPDDTGYPAESAGYNLLFIRTRVGVASWKQFGTR